MEEIRELIINSSDYVAIFLLATSFIGSGYITYLYSPLTKKYQNSFNKTQEMLEKNNYTLNDSIKQYLDYQKNCFPSFKGKKGRKLEEKLDAYIQEEILQDFEPKMKLDTPYSEFLTDPVLCDAVAQKLENIQK